MRYPSPAQLARSSSSQVVNGQITGSVSTSSFHPAAKPLYAWRVSADNLNMAPRAIRSPRQLKCPREDGSHRTGCSKQQPRGKPWKKVSPFVHPSTVPIPDHSLCSAALPQPLRCRIHRVSAHSRSHLPITHMCCAVVNVNAALLPSFSTCSGRTRQNHAFRDDNPVGVVDVPLLRARRGRPRR